VFGLRPILGVVLEDCHFGRAQEAVGGGHVAGDGGGNGIRNQRGVCPSAGAPELGLAQYFVGIAVKLAAVTAVAGYLDGF